MFTLADPGVPLSSLRAGSARETELLEAIAEDLAVAAGVAVAAVTASGPIAAGTAIGSVAGPVQPPVPSFSACAPWHLEHLEHLGTLYSDN